MAIWMARKVSAVPVILLIVIVFLAVSGTARPLDGNVWKPVQGAISAGDGGAMQFLRQMYQQQLRAGPSCGTNSANGGCPRHP
ncbi:unnamed protein product [Urochloa decumbens]|uniref:Uncharacterized protein n=1 Tax=Urochloa decumbens TaxID=240449 RepID=A0ABC9DFF9_9POAL